MKTKKEYATITLNDAVYYIRLLEIDGKTVQFAPSTLKWRIQLGNDIPDELEALVEDYVYIPDVCMDVPNDELVSAYYNKLQSEFAGSSAPEYDTAFNIRYLNPFVRKKTANSLEAVSKIIGIPDTMYHLWRVHIEALFRNSASNHILINSDKGKAILTAHIETA